MPPPPPPPPPGGPPPPPMPSLQKASKGAAPDRSALLTQIRGGAQLKKTVTNDRSAPIVGLYNSSLFFPPFDILFYSTYFVFIKKSYD